MLGFYLCRGHYVPGAGIWWQDLATELDTARNFRCTPKSDSNLEIFSLRVMLKRNAKAANNPQAHFIPNYVIHLLPPLIVHNHLPYGLELLNTDLKQHMKIDPGERSSAYSLDLSKDQRLQVKVKYSGSTWRGNFTLTTHFDEKTTHLSSEAVDDNQNRQLSVHIRAEREGSCNVFFYAPYWIVNKTGLSLHVKVRDFHLRRLFSQLHLQASSSNVVYDGSADQVLLFSYKRHRKRAVNLKVCESEWSNDFGMECVATTGLVVCKDSERKKKYSVMMSVTSSQISPRLTKIVTFMPSFVVRNGSTKMLR